MLPQGTEPVTLELIAERVDMTMAIPLFAGKVDRELLIKQIESLHIVFAGNYKILQDQSRFKPWLRNKKADIEWNFWNRYRDLLEREKKFAPATINKLDNMTDDILDCLLDPTTRGFWDKRGMVVGQVQSGKTSNYIGLICKAVDAGFKLIIALAGIHNTLRSQTQLRIDEGFVGFDTQVARSLKQTSNRIGVGRINPNLAVQPLTTSSPNGDFKRSMAESLGINIRGNDPLILVIKKNTSIMKNLIQWLAARGDTMPDGKKIINELPLLLIDDEADNASINISEDYISTINGSIRSLLSLFGQSAYVGYTATPFANIFIPLLDEEIVRGLNISIKDFEFSVGQDLFPRDFIINLPAPSNYIGPTKIFGIAALPSDDDDEQSSESPVIIAVNDFRRIIPNRHKKNDPLPEDLPESLKEAIKSFILSCAARRARGQVNVHNSMLVHVTRFVRWQDKISALVDQYLKFYQRQLEANLGSLKNELKELWNTKYRPVTSEVIRSFSPTYQEPLIRDHSWETIEPHLYSASAKIQVRAVHGDKNLAELRYHNITPLDYFEYEQNNQWLSVIAVGGNKLSRGLTLEGLVVSYYLRASKMYDTLMQMGRWFGYRPGYLDLCRLFTSNELIEWYKHITLASEEVREEFDYMSFLKKTPKDYGLKVRTHPGALQITATNKFGCRYIMQLSYSGDLKETYEFKKDEALLTENFRSTQTFLSKLGEPQTRNNQPFVWEVDFSKVIEFLSFYKTFQASLPAEKIRDYISKQTRNNNLVRWTIVLVNTTKPRNKPFLFKNQEKEKLLGLTFRKNVSKRDPEVYQLSKSHIISPSHEFIDFDKDSHRYQEALKETQSANPDKKITIPSGKFIRKKRTPRNGLLLIYPLDPRACEDINIQTPIIGYAMSFPEIPNDVKVEYAVNEQFRKELDYPKELDIEEVDDE